MQSRVHFLQVEKELDFSPPDKGEAGGGGFVWLMKVGCTTTFVERQGSGGEEFEESSTASEVFRFVYRVVIRY